MKYLGYEIEKFFDGFTVFYEGDEVYFTTIAAAKDFIKEVFEERKQMLITNNMVNRFLKEGRF